MLKKSIPFVVIVLVLISAALIANAGQLTKTFTFTSGAESWAGITGAATTYSSTGGYLSTTVSGKNKSNASAGWELTGVTWESLGVPAGSTVTSVDGRYDWRPSVYTTGASSNSGNFTITDSVGGNSMTLETGIAFSAASTSFATRNASVAINVPAAIQNSNSQIVLNISGTIATGASNSAVVTRLTDNVVLVINYLAKDTDGNVTASSVIVEPVNISSTADTVGERIGVFDFNISDGGTADGLALTVSQIVINTSGTGNFADMTWQLNGPDASYVTGTVGAGTITFSGLNISIANAASETYAIYAYVSSASPTSANNSTFILSLDGDTNLTVGSSGTQMGATTAVTNGTGSRFIIVPNDSDGNVTAGPISEPIHIASTIDTSAERVGVLDFNIVDGGTSDAKPLTVSQIVFTTSGTGDFGDMTWQLNGPDASYVTGTVGAGTITFSGLNISVANAASETYTLYAYVSAATPSSSDNSTFIISLDGDTNMTVGASGTMMGSTNAVTSGAGSQFQIVASKLIFGTQPPSTALPNTDFAGTVQIKAVDEHDWVDTNFTQTITISAVNDSDKTSASGSLSSTDAGGLTKSASAGVVSWTDLKYSGQGTIDIAANTSGFSTVYSTAVSLSGPQVKIATSSSQPPYVAIGETDVLFGIASTSIPSGTDTVSSVVLRETGTIDSAHITNLELWLSNDPTLSVDDEQLGNTTVFGADDKATFSESFIVGMSSKYLLIKGGVSASAGAGQTAEIEIFSISAAGGSQGTPLAFDGSTTVWGKRMELTFNNSSQSEAAADLPVLVKLNGRRVNYNDFGKTDGSDVRFVDSDEMTELPYEIEEWNSSGESYIWVNVPEIQTTNTDSIYMYYGNAYAGNAESTNTWSSDFKAVWHFAEQSSSYLDSTSNTQNSSVINVTSRGSSGKIGYAPTLDGQDDYIIIPDSDLFDTYAWTISGWGNMAGNGKTVTSGNGGDLYYPLITKGMGELENSETDVQFMTGVESDYRKVGADFENDSNSVNNPVPSSPSTQGTATQDGNWFYFTATVDPANLTSNIYLNGVLDSYRSVTGIPNIGNSSNVTIGAASKSAGVLPAIPERGAFNGRIDEIRFASSTRSASWIKTDYLSVSDNLISWPLPDTISSSFNQTFITNSSTRPAATITITAGNTISTYDDFRISIPASLAMSWDPNATSVILSGTAAGKVSNAVSYEGANNDVVVFNVTSDMSPGDTLTISGLYFKDFISASGPGNLNLYVGSSLAAYDDKTLEIKSSISEINLVQHASTTQAYLSPGTSITVNLGQTPVAGNLLIAAVSSDKTAGDYTLPSGFTLIKKYISANVSGALAYKVSAGNETSFTWGLSTSEASSAWVGEFEGLATTSPLDVSAEGNSGINSVTSQTTGTTGVTSQTHELAITTFGIDSMINAKTSRSWSDGFSEIHYTNVGGDNGMGGLSVATKVLTATGTQSSTITFSPTADQVYAFIATFKGTMVTLDSPVFISSASNQAFNIDDSTTTISLITISDAIPDATITAANDLRIKIPAGTNMIWETADLTASIGGSAAAKVSSTVSYESSGKVLVLNVLSDFNPGDVVTVSGLSFGNFSAGSMPDNLELVTGGSGATTVAEDDKTVQIAAGNITLSAYIGSPAVSTYVSPGADQYFGTIKVSGNGPIDAITLTEYGTSDADSELANVKLFLDDGDGNWEPGTDQQIGSAHNFDSSNRVSWSGLTINAGSNTYLHVTLDIKDNIVPLPSPTVGVQVAQASHVSTLALLANSWPLNLATSTVETIYPYLQNVSSTSIQIKWKTSTNQTGTVEYGLTNSLGTSENNSTPTKYHTITLSGLEANTVYKYRVTSGTQVSSIYQFRTAPAAGSAFSFLAYGDSRAQSGDYTFNELAASIAEAAVVNNPETLYIHVGDFVYGGTGGGDLEWQPHFFLPLRNILSTTALYVTPGNHDYAAADMIDYKNYFDPPAGSTSDLYYSFDYGNVHFISVDTLQAVSSGAQWTWLVNDLQSAAAQNATWRVLFTHKPAYSYGSHGGQADLQTAITNLVSQADKDIELVLAGDNHFYQRDFKPEGSTGGTGHFTVGGGGAELAAVTTGTYHEFSYNAALSYVVVDSGADYLKISAYNVNNALIDESYIPKKSTISSATRKTFFVNTASSTVPTITVTDGSRANINTTDDIRIKIPSGMNMTWDNSVTTVTLGGAAASKVSSTVSYENSNKTLVLNVTNNFSPFDSITISGLRFNNFTAASQADNLEMLLDGSGSTYTYYDDKIIQIKNVSVGMVQQATTTQLWSSPWTGTTTLTIQPASMDNILITAITTDKNSGAYTVPAGFTLIQQYQATNISGAMAYKVADGGETEIVWNYPTAHVSSAWVAEYSGLDPIAPLDVYTQNGTEVVGLSIHTGTTTLTSQDDELAIVMGGMDSYENATTSYSWSGGFEPEVYIGDDGTPALAIATKLLSSREQTGSVFSYVGVADQTYAGVATFRTVRFNSGSLSVGIVDGSGDPVTSPSVQMSPAVFSIAPQTTSGHLGTTSEKLRVTNNTNNAPWAISIAPLDPTAVWTSGAQSYDFNDFGSTDGADPDLFGGVLTVNPATASIEPSNGCSATDINLGSQSSFTEGSVDSVTLVSAGSTSNVSCYWDISGIDVSQVIPAQQTPANYSLDLVISIIAI